MLYLLGAATTFTITVVWLLLMTSIDAMARPTRKARTCAAHSILVLGVVAALLWPLLALCLVALVLVGLIVTVMGDDDNYDLTD